MPPQNALYQPAYFLFLVMAIVTYILLTAIHKGLEKNFNPKVCAVHELMTYSPENSHSLQILGESASRAIAVVLLDFVFVKLGCYFLNIQGSSQVVDLIAYGGYKFVGYTNYLSL